MFAAWSVASKDERQKAKTRGLWITARVVVRRKERSADSEFIGLAQWLGSGL
jgi:hypothetical protein